MKAIHRRRLERGDSPEQTERLHLPALLPDTQQEVVFIAFYGQLTHLEMPHA